MAKRGSYAANYDKVFGSAPKKRTKTMSDDAIVASLKRSGLLPRSIGKKYNQTGATTRGRDAKLLALAPGWRISASGNRYFENRRNRSDRSRRSKPWL